MKKLLVLVFAIALCLGVLCVGASADDHIIRSEPSEGDGSPGSPYKIDTVGTLYWFADYVNDGHPNACAVMTQDIYINVNVLLSNGNLNDVPPNELTGMARPYTDCTCPTPVTEILQTPEAITIPVCFGMLAAL